MDQTTQTITTDHDLLIRLDEKMNALSKEFKDYGDGAKTDIILIKKRADDQEKRIDAIEEFHTSLNAPLLVKQIQADHEWINGYKKTYKIMLALVGLIGIIVGIIAGLTNFISLTAGK